MDSLNHIFIWDTPSWFTVAFDNVHIVVDLVSFLFIFFVIFFYMDASRGNQLLQLSGLASLNKVCMYVCMLLLNYNQNSYL